MTKTADVWVVGTEKIGSGLVNVVIQGDVDAVTAAVKAGEAVAKEIGEVYAVNVIPRPHDDIAKILPSINPNACTPISFLSLNLRYALFGI